MQQTRRRVIRVEPGPGQLCLFAGAAPDDGPQEAAPNVGRRAFVDPSPADLVVGAGQRLDEFLRSTDQTEVFWIRHFVRSLSYEGFWEKYESKGRVPYHPAVMLGLVLYAITQGMSSLRQIEKLARSNVCAWWMTGGVAPDHSSIGRFLERHKVQLTVEVFEDLTRQLLSATGTKGTDLSGDGTTLEAATRRYRLVQAEAGREEAARLRKRCEELGEGKVRAGLERRAEEYEKAAEVAEERTAARRADRGKSAEVEPARVAPSDPDACYQKLKDGMCAPSYKPTIMANSNRMIVSQTVVVSSENKAIASLCEQAKRVNDSDTLERVRLDAGFYSESVIRTLMEQGVDDPLVTDRGVVADERKSKKASKTFPKGAFTYDPQSDSYECPAGYKLTRPLKVVRKGADSRKYSGAPCGDCPLKGQCTTQQERVIGRTSADEVLEGMRRVMSNPLARRKYAERSAMVEPVFSDLRQIQNLKRFRRRGLSKVSLEFSLHAMAHNLGRALRLLRRGGSKLAGIEDLILGLAGALWAILGLSCRRSVVAA